MEISEKQLRHMKFWKKFLRLTRGRVPTLRALEVIGEEEVNASFSKIIHSIRLAMEQGVSMSQALKKYPAEFSVSVVELIRVAEKSGAWDEILPEITDGLSEGTFD
jgi:type IV pilus assembly protein PilC